MSSSQILLSELRRREAQLLAEEGLSKGQIAREIGVAPSSVYRYLDPEYDRKNGESSRAAKKRRKGKCEKCGAVTRYGGYGATGVSRLCRECAKQTKYWTRERIIDAIKRFAEENGRPPKADEWVRADKEKDYPPRSNVYRGGQGRPTIPFQTWNEAIAAAGYVPTPPGYYQDETKRPEAIRRGKAKAKLKREKV